MFVGNQRKAPPQRARAGFRKFSRIFSCMAHGARGTTHGARVARACGFISNMIRSVAFQDLTSVNIGNGR
jgi:hypothetical protein